MRVGYGVGLWKAITNEWNLLSDKIAFEGGNGRRVSFWKDKWYGDEALCVFFPLYLHLPPQKGCECKRMGLHD